MARTVFANIRNFSQQGSGDKSLSSAPDVCKTPIGNSTPPIPYPVMSQAGDLGGGSSSVKIDGNPTALADSNHASCTGDEPGTAKGVGSGVTSDITEFATYSFDVKVEGKGVVRNLDMSTMNKTNTIGTVMGSSTSPTVIRVEEPEAWDMEEVEVTLESTFAGDQLHLIAHKDSFAIFMAVFVEIFGSDIPGEAYKQLYLDAQSNAAILFPEYEVAQRIFGSGHASIDSSYTPPKILIRKQVVIDAAEDNELRGELMTILIEEYGHYLDYLLRNVYAANSDVDAEDDEGAKFTYKMYQLNPIEQSDQHFADVTIDGEETAFIWDFSELHNDLKRYVNEARQNTEDRVGDLEFYKAGKLNPHGGEYGHEDITETALKPVFKEYLDAKDDVEKAIHTVYLGNWMRDMSQAVDPMIVRPMAYAMGAASDSNPSTYTQDTKVSFETTVPSGSVPEGFWPKFNPFNYVTTMTVEFWPVLFSAEGVTSMVELAAAKEFIHKKNKTRDEVENYEGHLNKLRSEYVGVNTETLGVYRPEEHIDNPLGIGQNSNRESRGDKELYDKFVGFVPNDHKLHQINKAFGLKNYIRSPDNFTVENEAYPSAYQYIISKLHDAAVVDGFNNPQALVDFGAAMHTLEDYFAHTNFTEISLIKSVEPMVFPWVDNVEPVTGFIYNYNDLYEGRGYGDKYILFDDRASVKPGHKLASYIPIVTGTFGLVDTAASVMPVLNEHLFSIKIKPWEKAKPGERNFTDILIREMLIDIDNNQADNQNNSGTNNNAYVEAYDSMLEVRDYVAEKKDQLISDGLRKMFHYLMQHISRLINFSLYFINKSIAATLNDAQVLLDKDLTLMEAGSFNIGVNPSHSQIAKDDPHHPVHELSSSLAIHAVREIGKKMALVWSGTGTVEADVIPELDKIMRHPAVSNWQDDIVIKWGRKNPTKVCKACSPSIMVDRLFHAIEEIDSTLSNMDSYLLDDVTIGKVASFFSDEEEAQQDVKALQNRVKAMIATSKEQNDRLMVIKKDWDDKYAKPNSCSGGGNDNDSVSKFYKIKTGDTLWSIAESNNTTVEALTQANGLSSDTIYAGDNLIVPGN